MSLTAGQKAKLRADGHKVEYFLSICQPAALLTAQVNDGTITRGETAIIYDNGTSSDPTLIREGMTLKVATDGGDEFIRVVSITHSGSSPNITGTITVDANNIDWSDGDSLQIDDIYEPTIIQPTFDPSTGISTKRGATYTDQNEKQPPVAKAGPGYGMADFLSGGSKVFNLSGSGVPIAEGAAITTYLWETTIGTLGTPAASSTTLTVNSAGQGWVSLTVTDDQASPKTHRTNRRVFVHDPDPTNADYPYTDFEMSGPSMQGLSAKMTITVNGVADFSAFRDGVLCIIWKREWYGDTEEHISEIAGAENIHFQGYILKDSIQEDWQHGKVSFEIGTILDVAKQMPLQALYLQAVAAPAYWFQYEAKMSLDKMLHWLIYWHSSLFEVSQIEFSGDTRYKKLYKWNETGLVSQIADIASKFRCAVGCDKAGTIHIIKETQLLDAAARGAIEVESDITEADRREDIQLRRRHRKAVSAYNLIGFNYDGVNVDTINKYQSVAPTRTRHNTGSNKQSIDGVVVDDQSDTDELCGRFLAIANNTIDQIRIKFSGNYSVLDLFPQRWWTLSLETPRELGLTDVNLLPRSINFQPDPVNGALLVDATFEMEAPGPDGITIDYPGVPDCPPGTGGTTEQPSDSTEEQEEEKDFPPVALTVFQAAAVNYRLDDDAAWTELTTDSGIEHGKFDPWWYVEANSFEPQFLNYGYVGAGLVKDVTGRDGTPVSTLPASDPPNTWSDGTPPTAAGSTFLARQYDHHAQGDEYMLVSAQSGGNWRGWLLKRSSLGVDSYLPLYDGITLPDQAKAIWMAVTCSHILVTVWQDLATDKLKLLVFDKSPFAFDQEFDLGSTSLTELDNREKWAFPVATPDYSASSPDATAPFIVAGIMVDPAFMAAGTYYCLEYSGAWTEIKIYDENGEDEEMYTDWLGSLVAGPAANGGQREYWAFRQGID
jgi:hypothetical protein